MTKIFRLSFGLSLVLMKVLTSDIFTLDDFKNEHHMAIVCCSKLRGQQFLRSVDFCVVGHDYCNIALNHSFSLAGEYFNSLKSPSISSNIYLAYRYCRQCIYSSLTCFGCDTFKDIQFTIDNVFNWYFRFVIDYLEITVEKFINSDLYVSTRSYEYLSVNSDQFKYNLKFFLKFSDCKNSKIRRLKFKPYYLLSDCSTVYLGNNVECPKADITLEGYCDYVKLVSINYLNYTLCLSYKSTSQEIYMSGSNYCDRSGAYIIDSPILKDFLDIASKVELNREDLPIVKGIINNELFLEYPDLQYLNDYVFPFRFSNSFQRFDPKETQYYIVPSSDHVSSYNIDRFKLVGDIHIVEITCSRYIQYNSTHEVCYDIYTDRANKLYPANVLFRVSKLPVKYLPLKIFNSNVVKNFTCNDFSYYLKCLADYFTGMNYTSCKSISTVLRCIFSDTVDYFVSKFISAFDATFSKFLSIFQKFLSAFVELLDFTRSLPAIFYDSYINASTILINYTITALGGNLTYNYTNPYLDDGKSYYLFGNWISGIFADLIKPFFDAWVSVLKVELNLFVDFVEIFVEALIRVFVALLDLLTDLVVVTIKLVVSLVIVVETRLLLFEYVALYLFLLFRVFDNNVFCLIILVLTAVVFGIERKSPSLLLFFVNSEYHYLNLTAYYNRSFSFNYSLSYYAFNSFQTYYLFQTDNYSISLN